MADTFIKRPVLYKGTKAQIESATMGENDFAVATDVEFYTKEEVDSLIADASGGGLESVTHDASLTGAGTADSPLAIAPTVTAQINSKADQTVVDVLNGEVSDLMADVSAVEADVMGKVAIAQGAENAGKILKVGDTGNATASFANQLKVSYSTYGWEEGTTGYSTSTRSETPKVGDLTIYNEEITEVGSGYIVLYNGKTYDRDKSLDTQTSEMLDIVEILANKADVKLSNITSVGKTLVANLALPSRAFIDLTLPASEGTYVAPADGYFYVQKVSTTGSTNLEYLNIYNRTASNIAMTITNGKSAGTVVQAWVPARKGDVIQPVYNLGGETRICRFIYAQGAR